MNSKILLFTLSFFLIVPASVMVSPGEASAQQIIRSSQKSGKRTHKAANNKRSTSKSRKTTRHSNTTTTRSTHHRGSRVVHRPVHRHHVTHHRHSTYHRPHRTHVRYGRYGHEWGYRYVYRPRYYVWGARDVHHYHQDRVVIHIQEPEPDLPELDCGPNTSMKETDRETWCATDRGHRHGPYARYHQNGEVAEEGWYEYGTKEGIWVQYHSSGSIKSEGAFQGNDRIGIWTHYSQSGEEISSTDYR